MSTLGLHLLPGRCPEGFAPIQHPRFCLCTSTGVTPWQIFLRACAAVRKPDGRVHQADVRPLIHGRIDSHEIGRLYSRAKREGVLVEVTREKSKDVKGRNTNKWDPIYELRDAA